MLGAEGLLEGLWKWKVYNICNFLKNKVNQSKVYSQTP